MGSLNKMIQILNLRIMIQKEEKMQHNILRVNKCLKMEN